MKRVLTCLCHDMQMTEEIMQLCLVCIKFSSLNLQAIGMTLPKTLYVVSTVTASTSPWSNQYCPRNMAALPEAVVTILESIEWPPCAL